jgi:hypothetical protein
LYIGDIGDNERRRGEVVVYRVEEPRTAACKAECSMGPATAIRCAISMARTARLPELL